MTKLTYSRKDVEKALREVGLKRGDTVFSHSNLGYFGLLEEGTTPDNLKAAILEPILEQIGPEGTFIVPTFTYSFLNREIFNPDETRSVCGLLTEMARNHPKAYRSEDPIFSVAAIGSHAEELTTDVSPECFGKGSFWDRFYHADGLILNMNLGVPTTFFHYVERSLKVPYRYDKVFWGTVCKKGRLYQKKVVYFCRDMTNYPVDADWMGIHELACERGLPRSANIGRGYITLARAQELYDLIAETLKKKPFFLTNSRNSDASPEIIRPRRNFRVEIPVNASMKETIEGLKDIPRDIVSDGYDSALVALAAQVPMKVYEYPTGTNCLGWIVPEKWTCYEGYLETADRKRLFSYAENSMHVASYSKPFEGMVSREDLFKHLWVNSAAPNDIPVRFMYYDMDWGLCCSKGTKDALSDDFYKVVIKSDFSFGSLKIGEVVIPGIKKDCIVLCSHLCNEACTDDGLTGVAIGVDVFRKLLRTKGQKYTYRLLVIPQKFNLIAHLSKNPEGVDTIKEVLFLDIFGSRNPHTLRLSGNNTSFNKCCAEAFKEFEPKGLIMDNFSLNVAYDEYRFNVPDTHIPMLSLSRATELPDRSKHGDNYSNTRHNSGSMLSRSLLESQGLIAKIIDKWELS